VSVTSFLNLDLALERAGERWRAHVVDSPAGQADHLFDLPFAADELQNLYAQFGRGYSARDASTLSLPDFGKRLYDAVFAEDVRVNLQSSRLVAQKQNQTLRLVLRLSQSAELQDLPWELLHDGSNFLALSEDTPLLRTLEAPQTIQPLTVRPPLRVLVVMASPSDYDALDLENEWRKLDAALVSVQATGLFALERLANPTLGELQKRLADDTFHILHFSGHGAFYGAEQLPALLFQDERGRAQRVTAPELGALVGDRRALRLVVLNACEGAQASTRDAFGGIAQALIRQTVPAVIANQFSITDEAAQMFSRTLYDALARGETVDAAVTQARKALFANRFPSEWAIPVLYARTSNPTLFDLAALAPAEQTALQVATLLDRAEYALAHENFADAVLYASNALKLDPKNADAFDMQKRAERERDWAQAYAQGKQQMDAGKLADALATFKALQNSKPNYRDVAALVAALSPQVPGATAVVSHSADPYDKEYRTILRKLLKGGIVPFLGQQANLFGRAQGEAWKTRGLPTSEELAQYLAESFAYDEPNPSDLIRVSQYISVMHGPDDLNDELHDIYDRDTEPTALHRFWAELPTVLRAREAANPYPIVFTANFDDLLERAFREENVPFDVLTYLAPRSIEVGKFMHRTFEGEEIPVEYGKTYDKLQLDTRATIVKVHGAVRRQDRKQDSFAVTEDHQLSYLRSDIEQLLPAVLLQRVYESKMLFIGVNLRRWDLRGLLQRLGTSARDPWVIQPNASSIDVKFWNMLNVNILNLTPEEFLQKLAARLNDAAGGAQ